MSAMRVGVVGAGRLGPALAGVLSGARTEAVVAAWAPVKPGGEAPGWAEAAAVPVVDAWQDLLERVDAVAVDLGRALHWHEREVLAEAAFHAGLPLLVDAPLADFPEVYDRILGARRGTGARLWSVRPLGRSVAVAAALEEVRGGAVGEVVAVHASLHVPSGDGDASFEQLGCDLLEPALGLAGGPLGRLYAEGERTPGEGIECVQAVGRTPAGAVVSLEIAEVLPPALGEARDVVIEVTGRDGLVRIEPDRAAVLQAGAAVRRLPWREEVLAQACEAWLGGADEGPAEAEADRRVIGAMRMLKRSRARGQVERAETAAGSA